MSETLLYSVDGGVASVVLNRPKVLNALDAELIAALRSACERARDDTTVRAILLRGNGPAFLAGGDIAMFQRNMPRLPDMVQKIAGDFHLAIMALRCAAKPVIASVHGAVAGAGISLLAAADLAIAAADTTFTLAYSKIGASPDGGATWFLPRLMGLRKALELMLLSDAFNADTALALGLVSRVVATSDLVPETEALVQRLAVGPTMAFAETKALINRSFERPLEAQLYAEVMAFARCARSADLSEGVTAFVEKRKAVFRGR